MLITDDYRKEQERLHSTGNYGVTAQKYGPFVSQLIDTLEIDHLLDYGCGSNLSLRRTLAPSRELTYQAYDPGVPDYSGEPEPAQMVTCIDVLEHIEPDHLEDVLDHLEQLTEVVLFATVHMGPAGKTLSDGRNAHLTQQPPEWWLPMLMERFEMDWFKRVSPIEFIFVGYNRTLKLEEQGCSDSTSDTTPAKPSSTTRSASRS